MKNQVLLIKFFKDKSKQIKKCRLNLRLGIYYATVRLLCTFYKVQINDMKPKSVKT